MAYGRDHKARVVAPCFVILLLTSALPATAAIRKAAAGDWPAAQILAQATLGSSPKSAPAAAAQPAPSRSPAAGIEARISDLHKTLHITPAQEPRFDAFADVMRANEKSMQALFQQRAQDSDMTAEGLLRWYTRLTTAHAEALNKLLPVFTSLYQSLSATQKKAADAAFQPLQQRVTPHKAG